MKKSKNARYMTKLVLMIVAGVFISFFSPQFSIAQDYDEDGILDDLDGQRICYYPTSFEQVCNDTYQLEPDLFIIFKHEDNSMRPSNPFELMPKNFTNPYEELKNLNTHVFYTTEESIKQEIPGTTQNALLLIEDQDPTDGDLGTSQIGYPALGNGISGRVFTRRIKDDVEKACALQDTTLCVAYDSNGDSYFGIDAIYQFYAKNVISHETFHMLGRVIPADMKVDYHYPQLGYIMDHHMYYKEYRKEKRVEWFITDKWSADDIPRFK